MSKRLRKLVFVFLSLSLFLLSFPSPNWAKKDYRIERVKIDAQINKDGSMDIREERTYRFWEHFHWATYNLKTDKTGGVVDFTVSEKGRIYQQNNSGLGGTFTIHQTSNGLNTKWFFDAKDEARTFVLSYRMLDVVKVYEDIAVLYHKFVGTGWDKPSGEVTVIIHPPETLSQEEVRAWAHGPLWGRIAINEDGLVMASVSQLPPRTFWEVRALYPKELLSEVKEKINGQILPTILAEEKRWSEEANRERKRWMEKETARQTRKHYGKWILFLLSGISVFLWISLYLRYGKRHKVPFQGKLYSEPPSDISPALLSYLLYNQQVGGQALVGTILDLAHRGFLKINENVKLKRGLFGKRKKRVYSLELQRKYFSENRSNLEEFEKDLLDFIFDNLAKGEEIIDFEIFKKNRRKVTKWFHGWRKGVKDQGKSQGWWEKDSLKARNKSLIIGGILLAITLISIFLVEKWALISGATAILVFTLSFAIPRRTPEALLETKKWKALRRYLKNYHFRQSRREEVLENINRFLVYGVVLGLSKKVIQALAEIIPRGEYAHFVPWYTGSGAESGVFSGAEFGEALSSLMTTASTTLSSAAGTGGGASGGGGGGSGGTGGGAG